MTRPAAPEVARPIQRDAPPAPVSLRGKLRALLELTRPPNLLTAGADVLAGFAVAGLSAPRALPWLLAATVCLYAGGVTLNDLLDRELDARERPERPLPSGRVTPAEAGALAAALLLAGVALALAAAPAAAAVAAAIAVCAALYDAWAKHHALAGPALMGSCRGLNLLLGLSAAPGLLAGRWPVALVPFAYVAGITAVSAGEVGGGSRRALLAALTPLGPALLALLDLAAGAPPANSLLPGGGEQGWGGTSSFAALPFLALLGWRLLPPLRRAWRTPDAPALRGLVRAGVIGLILLDAAIAGRYAGLLYPVAILALLPVAGRLARAFAVT